jgi:hypothetical protein
MLLTAAVLQTAYDVGVSIYDVARVKMVGAVSVMAVCASVPGQRSPSTARAAAKGSKAKLAAVLGWRKRVRLGMRSPDTARAPTTKLAPRLKPFEALQGGLKQGGLSCIGSLWFVAAPESESRRAVRSECRPRGNKW